MEIRSIDQKSRSWGAAASFAGCWIVLMEAAKRLFHCASARALANPLRVLPFLVEAQLSPQFPTAIAHLKMLKPRSPSDAKVSRIM